MKKLSLLLLSMVILAFTACKKNDNNDDNNNSSTYQSKGYIPLKVGSYWIYQIYREMGNGMDTALAATDSTYISGTIVVNSKTYYIIEQYGISKSEVYVRDSVGYLVDSMGNIIMSEINFSDTLITRTEYMPNTGAPMVHISRLMFDEKKQINVPAGVFNNCIEARDRVKAYIGNPAQPNPYFQHNYYAKNIGLVEYTYRFVGMAEDYKKKLIRYYIPN